MERAKLQDPELCRLAKPLSSTVLGSWVDSTVAKYGYALQWWKAWAEQRMKVSVFPISEVQLALYLKHLGESTQSLSAVQEAVNAMGWVNQLSGQEHIAQFPLVRATVAGLKRSLAKPKTKKEPVTVDMLSTLVCSMKMPPSLSELRLPASCLLAFAAFLCYDELAKLRYCDITFSNSSMSVCIVSSKTDQYRQDDTVLVARTGSPTCPVAMMERYFSQAKLSHSSLLLLFHGITCTKHGEKLRSAGGLSYMRMHDLFVAKSQN